VQVLLNCLGMTQKRPAAASVAVTPELLLRKATLARTSVTRAKYAQRGLAHGSPLDHTTRVLLLRQLYLSQMEGRRFAEALVIAEQMVETSVMPDVARQDAARACLGLGEREKAIEHLRIGSRVSPPARRAFHLWTLGTTLYFQEDYAAAATAFERAFRWGTTARPLYRAQLVLARLALGRKLSPRGVSALAEARRDLEAATCGQGYGRFVLGELAHRQGDRGAARSYFEEFIARSDTGRVALRVSLSAELARARHLLSALDVEESAKV
jgi:tetratricopeptide (TPR) repeat protein